MGRAGSFHIHSKSCYILPFWAVIYTRCDFILFTAHFLGIAGPSYCVIFERVVSPTPLAPLCFVQGLEIGKNSCRANLSSHAVLEYVSSGIVCALCCPTECAAQACWNLSWTTNWRRGVPSWRRQARLQTPSLSSTLRDLWRRTLSPWSTFVGSAIRLASRETSVPTTSRSGSSNRISTLHQTKDFLSKRKDLLY